jgi:tetratricopeptide (TPR) repeat protein
MPRAVPLQLHVALFACSMVVCLPPAVAQDRVTALDSRQREIVRTGQILRYDGRELRIRLGSGSESRIPSRTVTDVQTTLQPAHDEANRHFAAGDFETASTWYRQAYRAEKRGWVRRQILAQVVWCRHNLGQYRSAATTFLLLIKDDPHTLHFAAIPLAWRPQQPDAAFERQAKQWLAQGQPSAARLIASSWLLSTSQQPAAIRTLRELTRDKDPKVQRLALTQLWRTQLVTAKKDDVTNKWGKTIEQLPVELRGGPYFVLAQGLMRNGDSNSAILAFLRVPIQYSHLHRLASEALWEAAQLLEDSDDSNAARQLYQELITQYADTMAAREAHRRLRP